jgi:hypothetical protein
LCGWLFSNETQLGYKPLVVYISIIFFFKLL